MKRLPKSLRDLLKKHDRRIQAAFLDALKQQKSAVRIKSVVEALQAGNLNEAYRAIRIDERYFAGLKTSVSDAYWGGGRAVTGSVGRGVISQPVIPFDGTMPRAEAWVKNQTGKLVTNIVTEQQGLVQFVIQQGLAAAASPQTVALDLVGRINKLTGKREGGFIGLIATRADGTIAKGPMTIQSVKNVRNDLKTPEGMRRYLGFNSRTGKIDPSKGAQLRNHLYDPMVRRALLDNVPLSDDAIVKLSTKYEARALAYRGKVIAENEARIAVEAGRREAFDQMTDDGTISEDQVAKIWRHTPSKYPRPDHIEMDGVSVGLNESFTLPDGAIMTQPHDPAGGVENNVNCNCWADYTVGPKP